MRQIANEARVVDRLNRPQPHRDRGELPEIRHQPRMRIRTQSATRLQLAAKILQLLFRNAPFQISARVDSRRRVPLKINKIAVPALGPRLKEMIESDFVQSRRRSERRD